VVKKSDRGEEEERKKGKTGEKRNVNGGAWLGRVRDRWVELSGLWPHCV
jgi:hypothetical protein